MFSTQPNDRPEPWGGADREGIFSDTDRFGDERPVAADLDGVAVAGALHRLGQGVELVFLARAPSSTNALASPFGTRPPRGLRPRVEPSRFAGRRGRSSPGRDRGALACRPLWLHLVAAGPAVAPPAARPR